ncbi:DUF5692 family protein [Shewanella gelidii]|uniref:DUF2157 domain-containing protein n=1 Tax=Shewanella gelidii TaxID=1642821 RepID=A0A917JUL9_9GAMM|nr:DUF5692 family protein [Shewanella gelidii]MCL1098806.1 DUF5692 family protein [Shewanella gelidii]GGI87534.1 hypothetical protein GCM10009332_26000 [Shewanella gelidii]
MQLGFRRLFSAMIALVLIGFTTLATAATDIDATQTRVDDIKGKVWQGTRDGKPGEGSLFYRLEFGDSNQVDVLKQSGGFNKTEQLTWSLHGELLTITSADGNEIKDFDGATMAFVDSEEMRFTLGDDGFNFHKWYQNRAYLHVLFVLFGLMALNELCRRYKWSNHILWFVLPIALIPLWSSYEISYWFKWVKLYSVVGAAALFTLIRFTKIGDMKWAKFGAAAFLAINISEAVMQDFSMGNAANILNAIGGVLSIITLAGWAKIHADKTKEQDMIWPAMTTFWIVAYDVWNIVFVYLNFPGSATAQFMVLVAATLPALFIKKGTWLQARAFTLAGSFMYYFSCPFMYESNVVPLPRNDDLMFAAGMASFLINSAYAFVFFGGKWKQRQVAQTA